MLWAQEQNCKMVYHLAVAEIMASDENLAVLG